MCACRCPTVLSAVGSYRPVSTPVTAGSECARCPCSPRCAQICVKAVALLGICQPGCAGVCCRRVTREGQWLGCACACTCRLRTHELGSWDPSPAWGRASQWGAKGVCGCDRRQCKEWDVLNGVCGCVRERDLQRSLGTPGVPIPPQQARPTEAPQPPRSGPEERDWSPAAPGPRAVSDTRRRQRLYFSRLEPRPRARGGARARWSPWRRR